MNREADPSLERDFEAAAASQADRKTATASKADRGVAPAHKADPPLRDDPSLGLDPPVGVGSFVGVDRSLSGAGGVNDLKQSDPRSDISLIVGETVCVDLCRNCFSASELWDIEQPGCCVGAWKMVVKT